MYFSIIVILKEPTQTQPHGQRSRNEKMRPHNANILRLTVAIEGSRSRSNTMDIQTVVIIGPYEERYVCRNSKNTFLYNIGRPTIKKQHFYDRVGETMRVFSLMYYSILD